MLFLPAVSGVSESPNWSPLSPRPILLCLWKLRSARSLPYPARPGL